MSSMNGSGRVRVLISVIALLVAVGNLGGGTGAIAQGTNSEAAARSVAFVEGPLRFVVYQTLNPATPVRPWSSIPGC